MGERVERTVQASTEARAPRPRRIATLTGKRLGNRLLGVLALAASLIGVSILVSAPGSAGAREPECFTQTGFCIAAPDFQEYFHLRGGVSTFGYPISREFSLLGFRVQVFQGHLAQILPNNRIQLIGRNELEGQCRSRLEVTVGSLPRQA